MALLFCPWANPRDGMAAWPVAHGNKFARTVSADIGLFRITCHFTALIGWRGLTKYRGLAKIGQEFSLRTAVHTYEQKSVIIAGG